MKYEQKLVTQKFPYKSEHILLYTNERTIYFMHDLWCYGLVSKYSNLVSLSTGLQVIYCLDFRRKMTLGVLSYLGSTQMCVFLEENRRPNSFPLTCLFHEARILKVHLCLCS